MGNVSGNVYGLTILSPILDGLHAEVSHDCAIRQYLANLPNGHTGPFAKVSGTHMCRLVVMDDIIYVGTPAKEEHLSSKYLVFESNFDGELEPYLVKMATEIPEVVDSVWGHCAGYPGLLDVNAFVAYMKRCQLTTTFYFADVNNHSVQSTLRALKVQASVADFIAKHQGESPAEMQAAFRAFYERVRDLPEQEPGHHDPQGHQSIKLNRSIAAQYE